MPDLACGWVRSTLQGPPMRFLVVLVLSLALSAQASGQVTFKSHCLTSSGERPIRLEWRTFLEASSGWASSYVRYSHSNRVISLVHQFTEAIDQPTGYPWTFTSVWLEVVDGRFAGEYRITDSDARIVGFTYKNYRTGKKVSFTQSIEAEEALGCRWR